MTGIVALWGIFLLLVLMVGGYNAVWKGMNLMAIELETLKSEVEQNTSATDSAVTLLNSLSNQLREALMLDEAGTRTAIAEMAATLDANSNRLAAAVTANSLSDGDSNSDEPTDDSQAGLPLDSDEQPEVVDVVDSSDEEAGDGVSDTNANSIDETSPNPNEGPAIDGGPQTGDVNDSNENTAADVEEREADGTEPTPTQFHQS